jgi:hypothetical protein
MEGFRSCCLVVEKFLGYLDYLETVMMGHANSPETLVSDQTTPPGKTPKTFMQQILSFIKI